MDIQLFKKIIQELSELEYSGRLGMFSNNEPFLDSRIEDLTKYAREKLPNAVIYLYTNGTVLTKKRYEAIIPYLTYMIIDNYNDYGNMNDKIKIINDDAFNYFKKDIYYDYVFVDIWHDPSDGIDLYLKFKSLEKDNIKYSYWIEDTLKCYIE